MVRSSNIRSIRNSSPRRAKRRDARRLDILRAAARNFRLHGFADTGMREIAEAAELSPANLYHYFQGKDEILFYCQDRALDRMIAAVGAARRAHRHATQGLHSVLAAHARTVLDDVEGASAHLETRALDPARRAHIVKKRDLYERALRTLIEDGVHSGEVVADSPAIIARAMLGALNWTATWFDPAGPQTAAAVSDTIARFLVRGVAKDPGLNRRRPHQGSAPPGRSQAPRR